MMVLVRRSEHRTQHKRWCRCIQDDINKKVRTQDLRWFGYMMTSAGRSAHRTTRTTNRICACVYCVETGIVFTLAKFGEEAGSLVKLRWLGVIQIADLMKRTWCKLLKPCVCLHSQGSL